MGIREDVLALADELEGVSLKDDCESCLASGTGLCRGDVECAESAHKACAKRLREIVEHDECEDTTVSAYDLLSDDDRKAIAWVREYGGLDEVEKRIMPEGMEWPKHTDGELVRIGGCWGEDGCDTSITYIERIIFAEDGVYLDNEYNEAFYRHGERVKRPAPKVLDADGVEIGIGDKLYDTDTGCARIVRAINANGTVEFEGYEDRGWFTSFLTHRAPVLAADGEPLEVGQTVYGTRDQTPVEVIATHSHEYDGIRTVKCKDANGCLFYCPEDLTHTKPEMDTWERIERELADEMSSQQCGPISSEKAVDAASAYVRRCRALAEKGER